VDDAQDDSRLLDDLMVGPIFPHMYADQGLDLALERMGSTKLNLLPVVSRANVHQLVGVVTLQSLLDEYAVSHS